MRYLFLSISRSPFFQVVQINLWLNLKKIKKTINVSHSLPLFLNMSVFFFFPPLLCVLEVQNRVWQRKCDSDVLFFVLKLLSLADCVFIGCELQDVVLGSSLPADPPHQRYSGKSYPELTIKCRAELCQKAKQETVINNYSILIQS